MSEKRKLRILACPANEGGCAYYRIIMPMQKLLEKFPDDVEVKFDMNPLGFDTEKKALDPDFEFESLKWADVVFFQNIHTFGGPYTLALLEKAAEHNCFTHYDTDDLLTELYTGHRLYQTYIDMNLSELTKIIYRNADLVTVTQAKFAERIAPFCGRALAVVKNAIDFELPGWNARHTPPRTKKHCRFGWVGGIHHEEDVKEFRSVVMGVNSKVGSENTEWMMFGRPPLAPGDKGDWQQDVWDNYEKHLMAGVHKSKNNLKFFPAMPAAEYGRMFTHFDASIAMLQWNNFNDSKSEIKLMESGRYGLPLIATDCGAYSEVIKNGETGFLISKDNPRAEWIKALTICAKNPKLRKEMGANLKQIVDEYYDINKVVEGRLHLYRDLMKMKNDALEKQEASAEENAKV